ncbi:MAG: hypothetical protein AVDCRST_MAG26-1438, partial [uncultured Chloroflexia bacterium]
CERAECPATCGSRFEGSSGPAARRGWRWPISLARTPTAGGSACQRATRGGPRTARAPASSRHRSSRSFPPAPSGRPASTPSIRWSTSTSFCPCAGSTTCSRKSTSSWTFCARPAAACMCATGTSSSGCGRRGRCLATSSHRSKRPASGSARWSSGAPSRSAMLAARGSTVSCGRWVRRAL